MISKNLALNPIIDSHFDKRRHLLMFLSFAPWLGACQHQSQMQAIDAVVDAAVDAPSPISAIGQGAFPTAPHYPSLRAALQAVPNRRAGTPWRILLKRGRHVDKLFIDLPDIHLIGEGHDSVISYGAYAGQRNPDTGKPYTTQGCATLTVRAPGFMAKNLRIENSYDYLFNDGLANDDPRRSNDPQAVALMLSKDSDRAYFENVVLHGHQDTLYVDVGRTVFNRCRILGGVDFIFGAGNALFENCDLVSRPRRKAGVHPLGYITAASTSIKQFYGLTFIRCRLLAENKEVGPNTVSLGRPWHPAATFADGRYADPDAVGKVVYIDCEMGEHIIKDKPWWWMAGLQKNGPERTVFTAESARFFEYRSQGAPINAHRRQLSASEVTLYSREKILGGWQP
jgi:pectinesterase